MLRNSTQFEASFFGASESVKIYSGTLGNNSNYSAIFKVEFNLEPCEKVEKNYETFEDKSQQNHLRVLSLNSSQSLLISLVGGKSSALSKIIHKGDGEGSNFTVPRGFTVTVNAFEDILTESSNLKLLIENLDTSIQKADLVEISKKCVFVRF